MLGATGHVGTYLVPRLVEAGHEVIAVSRGKREPYQPHPAWKRARRLEMDRESESIGRDVGDLEPDAVIDMVCFTVESCRRLVEALRGRIKHFLSCCTIWVHGPSEQVPTTEEQPRKPFGEYGIQKAAIEKYLLEEARRGFPATVLHPGHIVGPGWNIVNPQGNFNPQVFARLRRGEELALPNLGLETVHHVHADDVAQAFVQALARWDRAKGESFHVVSAGALTLRGYAQGVGSWYGKPARLKFLPWDEWRRGVSPQDAESTWDHIAHSPCCSIAKAERLLDYRPRYTSLDAAREAVTWLFEKSGSPG